MSADAQTGLSQAEQRLGCHAPTPVGSRTSTLNPKADIDYIVAIAKLVGINRLLLDGTRGTIFDRRKTH